MSDATSPISESAQGTGRYVVIARRYRPQSFDELVGQEHVARALQQAISSDRVGHAYLFTGARGTGKTSAARIFAKALNCERGPTPTPCNECDVCLAVSTGDDVDVLEIDGASNNGVDQVRELRQNASVRPSRTRFKIYIIDEVHMLSGSAFNALLKTLEEPPEHVKFIFATTEPQKIPITILSRCQRFDFAGINASEIQTRLAQIAAAEGVEIEPEALQILAGRAAGSMRDSQSLLEQLLSIGHKRITKDDVYGLLGIAPAERLGRLIQLLVARDAAGALAELDATIHNGVDPGLLLDQLVGYFRDVMALAVGCGPNQMLYALPSQAEEVAAIGRQLGNATILAVSQILDQTAARMRVSTHGRTLVEMALVRICQLGELDDLAALVAELRGAAPPAAANKPQSTAIGPGAAPQTHVAAAAVAAPSAAKKNVEPPPQRLEPAVKNSSTPTWSDVNAALSATPDEIGEESRRTDPPHVAPPVAASRATEPIPAVSARAEASADPQVPSEAIAPAADSVLAQWQKALAENGTSKPATPPRPSRREQTAAVAEQPFVKKAMELFDVPPDKLRYTPPEGE